MNESMSSELLARYLTGEATPEEREVVDSWAVSAPDHAAELERLRRAWPAERQGDWNVDDAWNRVSGRLDQMRPAGGWARVPLAMAAALVLVFGGVFAWRALQPATVPSGLVATGVAERRTIELPDGTSITLAPNSELRIASGYGTAERRVDLTGQAWFAVQHNADRPFRVHAAGTVTEDLGTEFSIRALPGSSVVQVVLVSGSASLRRVGTPAVGAVVLHPRDVARLSSSDSVPVVERGGPVELLVSWRDGLVNFSDAPLDSVVTELSSWYGVRFELADPRLGSRRLSAPVRIDSLEEALEVLMLSLGVKVERSDSVIVIR